jgi:hypothetical protein
MSHTSLDRPNLAGWLQWAKAPMFAAAILAVSTVAAADPAVRNQGGVAYVSGGVGSEERQAIEAMGPQFNLKLTMAGSAGHFVSDVRVRIADSGSQTVLDTVTDGPMLFAQLKPGTYTVRCELAGKTTTQTVHISEKKQEQLTFVFAGE